jgi:hypothetical protein
MKKPNNLSLSDMLRFSAEDHLKHDIAVAKYKEYILRTLIEEVGSPAPFDIIFHLIEKYHPILKVKHKRGVKTKWGDYLNAMIAVEVQTYRDSGMMLKEAVWEVSKENRWKALFRKTTDKGIQLINKAYKSGKKSDSYPIALKSHYLSKIGVPEFKWDKTAAKMVRQALSQN